MLELSPRWARNMVTALIRLNGHPVGVVANQPHHLGGVIDSAASEKAAGFIRRCDAFGLPLVVLVDTPGFLPGTRQEGIGVIRHGAGLLHAFSAARVPKVTVVMRKAYGGGFITMNSRQLGADVVLAWPGAEIGVLGARQAVGIIHRRAIEGSADPERRARAPGRGVRRGTSDGGGRRRRGRRGRGDRAGRDEGAADLGALGPRRSQRTKENGMTTETIERTREGTLWREAPPYFDDLEIGDSMESSGRTVTEYDVVSFAALTGDWHPQHADAAWAAESPFGRRIAHGMLVLSYALGLLPIDPRVVLALRSIDGAVLKRPVGLGDTIRVRARLADKRELGAETGLVTLAVRIVNQADELVARMEIVVLWRRQPEAADGPPSDDELSPLQDGRLLA